MILNPVYHINDGRPAGRDAIHEFAYRTLQEQPREHHAPRVRQRRVRAEHELRNVDFHPVAPVGYGGRDRSREEHWSTEVQVSDSSGGNDEWDYDIVANRRGGAERVQPLPPRGQRPGEERVRFRDGIAVPREFGEGYGERRGAINGHLRFQEAGRRDEGEVRRIERLLAGVHLSGERGGGRARDGEVYGWDEWWEY